MQNILRRYTGARLRKDDQDGLVLLSVGDQVFRSGEELIS